jgi:hypothetical protein
MKLKCDLKNCYGIENFSKEFDFSKNKTFLIYASNGIMKTSFAKTFKQLQDGLEPKEEIYQDKSEYKIQIDNVDISRDEIFVIKPYVQKCESKNISTLLVDEDSKEKYEKELKEISKLKTVFLDKISKKSGRTKNDVENQILSDFNFNDGFYAFLLQWNSQNPDPLCKDVNYSHIFDKNNKITEFLKDENLQNNIAKYSERYNEILEKTPFFGKNAFNPSKADDVLISLRTNKFFTNNNKVKLDGEDVLLSEEDLYRKFEEAKKELTNDAELKKIQDSITKNADVRNFQALIESKPEIINELNDLPKLKTKIWNAYFAEHQEDIENLRFLYEKHYATLKGIEEKAILESTKWFKVIEIFKQRFEVPFEIGLKNSKSAILGKEVPNIEFKFRNRSGELKEINRDKLESIEVLSQGERRALYLLNIIFEIESRIEKNSRTLFIIDDVSDSFDYRNKYAIIEYLRELPHKAEGRFYQIILTHNFDFFRTVQERILMDDYKREFSFIAQKNKDGRIEMLPAGNKNIVSPFKSWKSTLKDQYNPKLAIAMIPFVRELLGYLSKSDSHYNNLTDSMHVKANTKTITFFDLALIYKDVLAIDITGSSNSVFESIISIADGILMEKDELAVNLENKIILSIASRLKAEYYMESCGITLEKTIGKTFEKYKKKYQLDDSQKDVIRILEKVVIMTPENIHLNSFMYEPILDMSDWHLKEIYKNVSNFN